MLVDKCMQSLKWLGAPPVRMTREMMQTVRRVAGIGKLVVASIKDVRPQDFQAMSRKEWRRVGATALKAAVCAPVSIFSGLAITRLTMGSEYDTYGALGGPMVLSTVLWGKIVYDWNKLAEQG